MKNYQVLEHTADLKLRAWGQTKEATFIHMAQAMFAKISDKKAIIKSRPVSRQINIKSTDLPALLIDFLNQLITLSDINNEIYTGYRIEIKDSELVGEVKGCKVKSLKLEIKAVTYNDLKFVYKDNQWEAEVVFDI